MENDEVMAVLRAIMNTTKCEGDEKCKKTPNTIVVRNHNYSVYCVDHA
jgi:hypothetical protein